MNGVISFIRCLFSWDTRQDEANKIAEANGVPTTSDPNAVGDRNAIQHAYFSAMLAWQYNSLLATILGNELEEEASESYWFHHGRDLRKDSFKDLWNDRIGILIGEYVKQNNLSQGDARFCTRIRTVLRS